MKKYHVMIWENCYYGGEKPWKQEKGSLWEAQNPQSVRESGCVYRRVHVAWLSVVTFIVVWSETDANWSFYQSWGIKNISLKDSFLPSEGISGVSVSLLPVCLRLAGIYHWWHSHRFLWLECKKVGGLKIYQMTEESTHIRDPRC